MNRKHIIVAFMLSALCAGGVNAQGSLKPFDVTDAWLKKMETTAPSKPSVPVQTKKKVLLFSLFTGFNHWVVPHTAEVVKIISKKSGAFEVTESKDIKDFSKESLSQYDVLVLDNNCSKGDHRDLFRDVLEQDKSLTEEEILTQAAEMENNLLAYVASGGGLVVLHGGIVMQNSSARFGEMVGGSFDYHPKQQQIDVKLVDAKHPLVAAFNGQGFSHIDEPYVFKNAYFDYNFHPLLYMETASIEGFRKGAMEGVKYVSWIKPYGKGRVFYSSPSHNAQSYDNPALLQFILDGMQYASGDLKCDDSPMKR
ncbi:ThuA domain-containing protein [Marinilongibacter aquaticus]|uniref:ThuA domain-containing protein n=1 Tax=Marinilongibacter aquaticus TaxID=2975157 RepID=UPI0021BD8B87|nr:ThuA domain-containing protein [Marinilongibacter aquaticus]UBM59044.1 ThuA domain-containing protein [Marinilongibacter aquaticus]